MRFFGRFEHFFSGAKQKPTHHDRRRAKGTRGKVEQDGEGDGGGVRAESSGEKTETVRQREGSREEAEREHNQAGAAEARIGGEEGRFRAGEAGLGAI